MAKKKKIKKKPALTPAQADIERVQSLVEQMADCVNSMPDAHTLFMTLSEMEASGVFTVKPQVRGLIIACYQARAVLEGTMWELQK